MTKPKKYLLRLLFAEWLENNPPPEWKKGSLYSYKCLQGSPEGEKRRWEYENYLSSRYKYLAKLLKELSP